MMLGLSNAELKCLTQVLINPLKKLGIQIFAFGSRARGDQQKFSDIDILLENALTKKREVSTLLEQIEDTNFPYKVDLVYKEELAESYADHVSNDLIEL